jgi:molybdate transport system permease protein
VASNAPLYALIFIVGGTYVLLLLGMLVADVVYLARSPVPTEEAANKAGEVHDAAAKTGAQAKDKNFRAEEKKERQFQPGLPVIRHVITLFRHILAAMADPKIQYSIKLTLVSCLFTAILSLMVAVPIGYALSRFRFRGRALLDAILDIPIVLPPLVVGLSLLILFQMPVFEWFARYFIYQTLGVVLAQFMVAAAFAVRIMRSAFDQIDTRLENVAMTLGCSRAQAFGRVVLPQARQGMLTAATMAWARALGEFGPLLIFAGTTRMKTEVLSTTVYLEQSVANIQGAVAVSLIMVAAAVAVLVVARVWGSRTMTL